MERPGRDRWPHLCLSGAGSNNWSAAWDLGQKDRNGDRGREGPVLEWELEAGSVSKACWVALV